MPVAYCVLSHRSPTQVERLVRRINELSPNAHVLVHHDPRGEVLYGAAANAAISAAPVHWGRWSMVDAMLRLYRAAHDAKADAAVLISGQDYPVHPLMPWEQTLIGFDAVMEAQPIEPPVRGTPPPPDDRYLRAWLRWYPLPHAPAWVHSRRSAPVFERARSKVLNRVQPSLSYRILADGSSVIGVRRRATPFDAGLVRCFWGPQWVALARPAIEHVLATPNRDPNLVEVFRRSLIPDESFVHTVVMNSPLQVLNARVTYARWTGLHGEEHPTMIDADGVAEAHESGTPFARKFDLELRPDLFHRADQLTGG